MTISGKISGHDCELDALADESGDNYVGLRYFIPANSGLAVQDWTIWMDRESARELVMALMRALMQDKAP